MGQVRYGSATTKHAVRATRQRSQDSLAQLSREIGINPKTVAKQCTGQVAAHRSKARQFIAIVK